MKYDYTLYCELSGGEVELPAVIEYCHHAGYPGSRDQPEEPAYIEAENMTVKGMSDELAAIFFEALDKDALEIEIAESLPEPPEYDGDY